MDINELRYFIQIAKDKNYTKAASNLFVSQPALSRAMKKLEGELGVPLFTTSSNGVFLTDYGNALLDCATRVVRDFDEIKKKVADIDGLHKGKLIIGATPMLSVLILEKALLAFSAEHQGIQIKTIEASNKQLRHMLIERKIDLAICIEGETSSSLEEKNLFRDTMVVCLSKKHRLASAKSISIVDLKDERFNFYTEASTLYNASVKLCRENGFTPITNFVSSNVNTALRITANDSGVSLYPLSYVKFLNNSSIAIVPLNESFLWKPCICKNPEMYHSNDSTLFEASIFEQVEELKKALTISPNYDQASGSLSTCE